jgi:hypothetical protein
MAEAVKDFTIEKWAVQMILRGLLVLLLIAAIAYPIDFAIWRSRVAAGGGMGQVSVDLYVVGELKGGKEDYYPQGTSMSACSKSLYPQAGNTPCWWLERHREQIQRY